MTSEPVALFSADRTYRYTLWREAPPDLFPSGNQNGYVQFIGLNPSTADELKDDPTVRRCIRFAVRWGYTRMCMTNLFAWRDTFPNRMMRHRSKAIGPDNDRELARIAKGASLVVAAWWAHGKFLDRETEVYELVTDAAGLIKCLKRNKDGTPMHPLYVPYSTGLTDFIL